VSNTASSDVPDMLSSPCSSPNDTGSNAKSGLLFSQDYLCIHQ
jgi:hypothetical protein